MKTFTCPVCTDEIERISTSALEMQGVPNCRNCDRTMIPVSQIRASQLARAKVNRALLRANKVLSQESLKRSTPNIEFAICAVRTAILEMEKYNDALS